MAGRLEKIINPDDPDRGSLNRLQLSLETEFEKMPAGTAQNDDALPESTCSLAAAAPGLSLIRGMQQKRK